MLHVKGAVFFDIWNPAILYTRTHTRSHALTHILKRTHTRSQITETQLFAFVTLKLDWENACSIRRHFLWIIFRFCLKANLYNHSFVANFWQLTSIDKPKVHNRVHIIAHSKPIVFRDWIFDLFRFIYNLS